MGGREQEEQHIPKTLKQFLWLVIPSTIAMFLLAFLIYSGENTKQRLSMRDSEAVNVSFAQASIQRELNSAISDLRFLANSASSKSNAEIVNMFSFFAINKKIYDQVRFLSLDGQEQVRVNFREGKANVVPKEGLQSKQSRYYFKYSIILKPGQLFVSPLDLNMERGVVERPLKPMIRLGMPVFDAEGKKRGVIILNYLAQQMLARFRNHANDATGSFRLLNRDGYWLSHEQWEKEWGFMLDRDDRAQNLYDQEWQRILKNESGQFETDSGLFSFSTVHPVGEEIDSLQESYFWKIIAHVPQGLIEDQNYRQLRLLVLISGPIYFVVVVLCAWLAFSRVKRLEVEKNLRESEERSRAIVDMSLDGVISTDEEGTVVGWNPAAENIFGYSEREALGKTVDELIVPEKYRHFHREGFKKLAASGRTGLIGDRIERPALRKDGGELPIGIAVVAQKVSNHLMMIAFTKDLTERKKTEERDRLMKAVFDETLEGICICDGDNNFLMVNKAFTEITGYRLRDVLGKNPRILSSGRHEPEFYRIMWETINEHGCWTGEIWNRHANGHIYPERISVSVVKDKDGDVQNYVAVFNDISEEKAAEEVILKQAHYDALTDLPNRFLFMDRLERAVIEAKRTGETFALLFIDLDRFKAINDTHGHQAGDDMLIEVASRLRASVRESDTVARLAGDEFTIISRNLSNEADLNSVVGKVKKHLCGIWRYDGLEIDISGSVGSAIFPNDGDNPTNLLQAADLAMYRVKQSK